LSRTIDVDIPHFSAFAAEQQFELQGFERVFRGARVGTGEDVAYSIGQRVKTEWRVT
jgi:hypothetical protein